MFLEYLKFNSFFTKIENVNEHLDKKYLLCEIIKEPSFLEGKIIFEILRESKKNMQEEVKKYRLRQMDYEEYIQAWVHEIKTPISAILLLLENINLTNKIKDEVNKIENYVEQILFHSKISMVGKDYIIRKSSLDEIVKKVIRKNSSLLIGKKILIDINILNDTVYTDFKWAQFIINQIIINCIKYSKDENRMIKIYTTKNKNNIVLNIEDNGVGIDNKEIDKVFEKGFSGDNGRKFGKSTGMGLYICKKLCNKLNINININSEKGIGTNVKLVFPINE